MRSSTSRLGRLRRIFLTAVLLAPLLGAPGPDAADAAPVAIKHPPFVLTGTSTISGGRLPQDTKRVSLRANVSTNTFELTELLGPLMTGDFTTPSRFDSTHLTLTFDAANLVQLGGQLQGRIQAALGGTKTVLVNVTAGSGSITYDSDRARRRLAATFLLDVTVDGGPVKKAKCRFKCSGAGRRVLLLDDEVAGEQSSGDDLVPALQKAGHYVFNVGRYSDWDGSFPAIDEFETVIWCQRFQYSSLMQPGAASAIDAFVQAGHGLVRTEWSAFKAHDTPVSPLDVALPVTSQGLYARELTWKTVPAFASHALVRKLPKTIRLVHTGFSTVTAVPGATVVSADPAGVPCITFAPYGLGTIVHLNYGRWEDTPEPHIPAKIMRAFLNSVEFTAP